MLCGWRFFSRTRRSKKRVIPAGSKPARVMKMLPSWSDSFSNSRLYLSLTATLAAWAATRMPGSSAATAAAMPASPTSRSGIWLFFCMRA